MESASEVQVAHIKALRDAFNVSDEDLHGVRRVGQHLNVPEMIDHLYQWLQSSDEFHRLFTDNERIERVKNAQGNYWREFLRARLTPSYIQRRRSIGQRHAAIGLTMESYFSAMNFCVGWMIDRIPAQEFSRQDEQAASAALRRLAFLDQAVVVSALASAKNEVIAEQAESLMQLSSPVLMLWDRIVLAPMVGAIDAKRAQVMLETLLERIARHEAAVAIVDVTGVSIMDNTVAESMLKMACAARMLGCKVILTGTSPQMAQTLVDIDINLRMVESFGNLRTGLAAAMKLVRNSSG